MTARPAAAAAGRDFAGRGWDVSNVGDSPSGGRTRPGPGSSSRAAQVRSLRLPTSSEASSRSSVFAWLVTACAVCGVFWALLQLDAADKKLKKLSEELEEALDSGDGPPVSSRAAGGGGSGTGGGGGAAGAGGTSRGPQGGASGDPAGQRAVPAGEVALQSKGYIIPAHQILVSPQVSGRLISLFVEEGRTVEKGALLGEIESTEFRADVARAKATLELNRQRLLELETGNRPEEIDQAKADLAEAEAQLVQLEAEFRRGTQLLQSKVITTQDFELIESKFRSMQKRVDRWKAAVKLATDGPRKERIESARAEMQQAEADLVKAQWRLDNCRILAPISGTILKKNAEEGNIVNPIAFNGSFSVCDIADLADLEVSLDISERDVSLVFPNQRCQVRTEAFPNRLYEGWVSRLMPIADRAKGAIPVRVKLSVPKIEQGVYLKPEMGALVSFISGKPRDTAAEKTAEKAADAPRDAAAPSKPLEDDANSGTKAPAAESPSGKAPAEKTPAEKTPATQPPSPPQASEPQK